jgi:hypothetical protein
MALQDFGAGRRLALLDPYGGLVEELLAWVPPDRSADVLYLGAPDVTATWTYNPLGGVSPERRALAVAGLVEVFRRLWHDAWVPWCYRIAPATLTSVAEPTSPVFTSTGRPWRAFLVETGLSSLPRRQVPASFRTVGTRA